MGCPVIDHLACKIPGTLEPRIYDVWKLVTLPAGFRPQQSVSIANRDAPWHLASIGWKSVSGSFNVQIKLYNSRGTAMSDDLVRVGHVSGGANAARPVNPSYVWPVNSSLVFDLQNLSGAPAVFHLFFFGFKVFDRGKAPC